MAAPSRPVVDCIQLSQPIVFGGAEQYSVDVYRVRIIDLDGIDLRGLMQAVGMTPAYIAAVTAADDKSPAPDPVPDLGALIGCASTLRTLLGRITPLAPPQVDSIDARDLLRCAEVVLPLVLPSAPTEGSAGR